MAGGTAGKLTDIQVKAFAAKAERRKKLADGGGLYLFITPAGTATWRIKYRYDGNEKLYSIGPYPDISLKAARIELDQVKTWLRNHKDPMAERRINRATSAAASGDTFIVAAEQWLALKKKEWSAVHYAKSARAFERDIYPALGRLPISSITPAIVSTTIERINARDVPETASRILQHLNGVFRYAQAKGLCRDNPALPAREVLPRKRDASRMAAVLDFPSLGDILRRAQAARLSPSVYMAHRLLAFTTMRIANVVEAEWREFDLDAEPPLWVIPRAKLKKKDKRFPPHRVPLAPAIAAELREWRSIIGRRGFVFPSPANEERPITRESLEKAYRETLNLKNKHTPHGWRSSLTSQALDHGFPREVVLIATDHTHDSDVALAYDRGERFAQRIELFNWWSAQLVEAQAGAKVVGLPKPSTAAA